MQILDEKIGLLVPHMELTVVSHREQQITTIGADARNGCTLAVSSTIILKHGSAEGAGLLVEGNAHHIVAHLSADIRDDILTLILRFSYELRHMRHAVVEFATIGRPAGESFKISIRFENIGERMIVSIVEHEV